MKELNGFGQFLYGVTGEFIKQNVERINELLEAIEQDKLYFRPSGLVNKNEPEHEVYLWFEDIQWHTYGLYTSFKESSLRNIDGYNLLQLMIFREGQAYFPSTNLYFSEMEYSNDKGGWVNRWVYDNIHKTWEFILDIVEMLLREYAEVLGFNYRLSTDLKDLKEDLNRNKQIFENLNFNDLMQYLENKYYMNFINEVDDV